MYPQLFTVTSQTLLQSIIKIPDYVRQAKKNGATALGIMDENRLSGVIDFYLSCKKAGIKAILGMSFVYEANEKKHSLQLIALNKNGYHSLMELSTKTQMEEKVTLEMAMPFIQQDVVIIANESSEFYAYAVENFALLEAWFQPFRALENFFIGIHAKTNTYVLDVAEQLHLKPFAMREVRYFDPNDHFAYEIAKCIHTQQVPKLEEIPKQGELYYQKEQEVTTQILEKGFKQAIDNAEKVAEKVAFDFEFQQSLYPTFPLEEGEDAKSYLATLARASLHERVKNVTSEYTDRLEQELSVIFEMGFADYFLIVWDVLKFARRQHIFLGAGRGSAAGSLVAYVLKITNVDPIEYRLLFERFLNKERFNPPDIDIDIPDDKRPIVLEYVWEKYGKEYVAHIATFGTLAARQVLQDVARVFGLSVSEQRRFSKAVPNVLKVTLERSYGNSKNLRDIVKQSQKNEWIFQVAKKLEGLPRNISTHAAGILISNQPLKNLIPLQRARTETLLTQMEQRSLEQLGLLKMDFLGLKNLKYIQQSLTSILHAKQESPDLMAVDLTDEKTLKLFKNGDTLGIFQFESNGMRQALKTVAPTNFEEVIAMVALFRPGPQASIPTFAKRKAGKERVSYPAQELEPILKNTYGIMVYQEQVMQVAQKYAGYTLAQADILRRAISKKKKETLDQGRAEFVEKSVKLGHEASKATEIYDYIEKFANYGFNRSHAVAYSFVSFQMAYLKAHYPSSFFQTLLHNQSDKIREYVDEAKRFGVKILPPDINYSNYGFKLEQEKELRFGLSNIRGVRKDFIQELIAERRENGHFATIEMLLLRLSKKWLKIDYLAPLVYSGSLDLLGANRKQMIESIEGKIKNILLFEGSINLFEGQYEVRMPQVADFSDEERRAFEEKYLGINLGKHPTEKYSLFSLVRQNKTLAQIRAKMRTSMVVQVFSLRKIRTKKQETMAFAELEDMTGKISSVFFPEVFLKAKRELIEGALFYVEGKADFKKDTEELQFIVNFALPIKTAIATFVPYVWFIRVGEAQVGKLVLYKALVSEEPKKECPVFLVDSESKKTQLLPKKYWLSSDEKQVEKVKKFFGEENVKKRIL